MMQEQVDRTDARELLDALAATSVAAERRAQRPMASVAAAARGGLGRSQLAILRWLSRFECLRISELATRLGCTAQNVSQIVRRLLSAGLVELVTFARRRHWRAARVTDRGRRAIGEHELTARQNAEDVFSVLAEEERRMFADLLAKVRERRADLDDPGALETVSAGPPEIVPMGPEQVARWTPPEVNLGPRRDEELRARASQIDPTTLPPYELCIWEYERDGLRAPEHMYTVVELMRDAKRARQSDTDGDGSDDALDGEGDRRGGERTGGVERNADSEHISGAERNADGEHISGAERTVDTERTNGAEGAEDSERTGAGGRLGAGDRRGDSKSVDG